MKTIYELYDALLTIKEYCTSNNTCEDCPLTDNGGCCIFTKDTAPLDWNLVEPTRRLYE